MKAIHVDPKREYTMIIKLDNWAINQRCVICIYRNLATF